MQNVWFYFEFYLKMIKFFRCFLNNNIKTFEMHKLAFELLQDKEKYENFDLRVFGFGSYSKIMFLLVFFCQFDFHLNVRRGVLKPLNLKSVSEFFSVFTKKCFSKVKESSDTVKTNFNNVVTLWLEELDVFSRYGFKKIR